ncbi:MAG: hypothetical protein J7605_09885 [Variovorax sp.]|nr:hypothetical protein [Variovorax sp.]
MSNPWFKKNPLLSVWLSAANAAAGTTKAHATIQAKRATRAAANKAAAELVDFWSAPYRPAGKNKRRR